MKRVSTIFPVHPGSADGRVLAATLHRVLRNLNHVPAKLEAAAAVPSPGVAAASGVGLIYDLPTFFIHPQAEPGGTPVDFILPRAVSPGSGQSIIVHGYQSPHLPAGAKAAETNHISLFRRSSSTATTVWRKRTLRHLRTKPADREHTP